MGRKHFLEIAHERMAGDRNEHLWTPGSTAWAHYTPIQSQNLQLRKQKGMDIFQGKQGFCV